MSRDLTCHVFYAVSRVLRYVIIYPVTGAIVKYTVMLRISLFFFTTVNDALN